jgi:hypothetical protein
MARRGLAMLVLAGTSLLAAATAAGAAATVKDCRKYESMNELKECLAHNVEAYKSLTAEKIENKCLKQSKKGNIENSPAYFADVAICVEDAHAKLYKSVK